VEHVFVKFYFSEKLAASTRKIKRIVNIQQNWSTQAKIKTIISYR